MLQDFIEANGLQAKILPFAVRKNLIQCWLFCAGDSFFLVILFASDSISEQKLRKAAGSDAIKPVENAIVDEITGYAARFLPPISIFGVKALIDKKVLQAQQVHCLVAEEKTLAISPKEIKDFNDDAAIVDITQDVATQDVAYQKSCLR